MDYSLLYLDTIVTAQIDRPLGSKHPRHELIYSLNYGFVPNTKAPDGSELDVYILGQDAPLQTFTGRCIAVLHRTDDNDDKLIICKDGEVYSDKQIEAATAFQEQYFNHTIIRPVRF